MARLARTAVESRAWCAPGGMAGPTTAPVSIAADTPQRTTRSVSSTNDLDWNTPATLRLRPHWALTAAKAR